jgi:branched-chain amino acid transport system substrate-binding protein
MVLGAPVNRTIGGAQRIEGRRSRPPGGGRATAPGLLAALLLALSSCGGMSPARPLAVGPDIVVGAAISATGALAGEGQLIAQGYRMWLDWVNAGGGIRLAGARHRVRLLLADDQSRPDLAAALVTEMVTRQGAQFLLGPYGSDATVRVAGVADQYRVPLVAAAGAAQSIFDHGYRYVFGVASLTDQYFTGVLDMAAGLRPRPRTIALLSADDSFSVEVAQLVETQASARGFQVVLSQRYPAGTTDVMPLVARAAAVKPDMLVNSGHLAEAVAIHRAARTLALDARLFAYSVGPSTPEFIAQLGPDADYVFAGSQWTPQLRYQPDMYLTAPAYIAAYRMTFGTLAVPSYQTADGTAAGLALQRAIEKAGSTDPRDVRNALVGLDVMTFAGRLEFDGRGANVYKPMVVEQILHSRHHTVYPPSVADTGPVYPTPAWSDRP